MYGTVPHYFCVVHHKLNLVGIITTVHLNSASPVHNTLFTAFLCVSVLASMNQGCKASAQQYQPGQLLFSKEKGAALGGTRTHNTPLSRQSALPTELPGQLSKQGSKSTIQHKQAGRALTQHKHQTKSTPNTLCYGIDCTEKPSLNM